MRVADRCAARPRPPTYLLHRRPTLRWTKFADDIAYRQQRFATLRGGGRPVDRPFAAASVDAQPQGLLRRDGVRVDETLTLVPIEFFAPAHVASRSEYGCGNVSPLEDRAGDVEVVGITVVERHGGAAGGHSPPLDHLRQRPQR